MADKALPFDAEGVFWLADSPDDQVAGTLTYNVENGGTLRLIGTFGGPGQAIERRSRRDLRILGVAGRKQLTLDQCFQQHYGFETPGIFRETFHVPRVFAGAHFEADEALAFDTLYIEVSHLQHWVSQSGMTLTMVEDQERNLVNEVRLEYRLPEAQDVAMSDGATLRLAFTYHLKGDHIVRSEMTQDCYLQLSFTDPVDFDTTLLGHASAIQDLLSLASDAVATPTGISVRDPSRSREMPSGRTVHDAIDVWLQTSADGDARATPTMSTDWLFTFAQLGGLSGVSEWLHVATRFRAVLGSLMSTRYAPTMYTENRLQNLVQAAETFHRIAFPNNLRPHDEWREFKKALVDAVPKEHREWLHAQLQYSNEPRLRHRLTDLAEYAGPVFGVLVGQDVDGWIRRVVETRNAMVHHKPVDVGAENPWDSEQVYWLAVSMSYLVILCLLRAAGATNEVIQGVQENRRFQWTRRALAGEPDDAYGKVVYVKKVQDGPPDGPADTRSESE